MVDLVAWEAEPSYEEEEVVPSQVEEVSMLQVGPCQVVVASRSQGEVAFHLGETWHLVVVAWVASLQLEVVALEAWGELLGVQVASLACQVLLEEVQGVA